MKVAPEKATSGSSNFSLVLKLFSSTAPVRRWRRRVRTIVEAPRAEGDANVTSTTAKGSPSTLIIIRRFNSFAPVRATVNLPPLSFNLPNTCRDFPAPATWENRRLPGFRSGTRVALTPEPGAVRRGPAKALSRKGYHDKQTLRTHARAPLHARARRHGFGQDARRARRLVGRSDPLARREGQGQHKGRRPPEGSLRVGHRHRHQLHGRRPQGHAQARQHQARRD